MAPRPVTGRGARFSLVRLFDSAAEIDKAHGGADQPLGRAVMLVFGLLMVVLWQWLRPAEPPATEEAREI